LVSAIGQVLQINKIMFWVPVQIVIGNCCATLVEVQKMKMKGIIFFRLEVAGLIFF
jgi:hypothetical protein